jgi:2-methylisocitrate lyase-like PEP mutase family enzyme
MHAPENDQPKKAEQFRALHSTGKILLLSNVWDVASARVIEEAGFDAIATTSAGIAFSLGYADGEKISREEMLTVVTRIARSVGIPVTADVEAGYGSRAEDAAQTAKAVIEAGAIGMNLEDADNTLPQTLVELPLQLEKIGAVRDAARNLGVPLVLNARTDVYLLQIGDPARRYDEAIRRVREYRDAGADCVFVPGVRDTETIGRLVKDLKCPLNILAGPGSPSVSELHKLGVARVSLGSAPARAALGLMRRIAEEVRTKGTYTALEDAPSHAEMNRILQRDQK